MDDSGTEGEGKCKKGNPLTPVKSSTQRMSCSPAELRLKRLLCLDSDSDTGSDCETDKKDDSIGKHVNKRPHVEDSKSSQASHIASSFEILSSNPPTNSPPPKNQDTFQGATELRKVEKLNGFNSQYASQQPSKTDIDTSTLVPQFANPDLTKLAQTKMIEVVSAIDACIVDNIEAVSIFQLHKDGVPGGLRKSKNDIKHVKLKVPLRVPEFDNAHLTDLAQRKITEISNAMKLCIAQSIQASASFQIVNREPDPACGGSNMGKQKSDVRVPKFANADITKLAREKSAEVTRAMESCIAQTIEASTSFWFDEDSLSCDGKKVE